MTFAFEADEISRRIIREVFRHRVPLYPDESNVLWWNAYRNLYEEDPDLFLMTAPLHSNHIDDPLHISVKVEVDPGWFHFLHINCFISGNGGIIPSNVTCLIGGRVVEVVTFTQRQPRT